MSLEKIMLTDQEMAEAQGEKEVCRALISSFGSCKGCSGNCPAIARAQIAKLARLGYGKMETFVSVMPDPNSGLPGTYSEFKALSEDLKE